MLVLTKNLSKSVYSLCNMQGVKQQLTPCLGRTPVGNLGEILTWHRKTSSRYQNILASSDLGSGRTKSFKIFE